jgi:DNA-binding NarL/FixJ family response regulator
VVPGKDVALLTLRNFSAELHARRTAMRIVLADQQAVGRSSLKILFRAQPDLELVGEAADVGELISQVKASAPDVIVLDFDLIAGQIDVLMALLRSLDNPPAVVAMSVRSEYRRLAAEAGFDGFAYKGDPPERLLAAMRDVCTR